MSDVLQIRDLRTHFHVEGGGVARAVDGISFSIEEGRTLALVGESGCGKSQTAFSIMRLAARNAFHGEHSAILFDGENLLEKSEADMQRIRGNDMAMIFQEPMSSLNPLYRIGNQLSEPLMLHQGMDRAAARTRAIALLNQVGIPAPESRIDNFPHELSGGMKQRVMIAMALACRPRLLIADEPTTALDVTIQAQILSLMKDLQTETGMSILLITHNMGVVNQLADDVCVMYAGKLAEFGTRDDLFERPQHPYTRRLLESIPAKGDVDWQLHTIPGQVPSPLEVHPGCRFCDRCVERIEPCSTIDPPPYPDPAGGRHLAFCHLLNPELQADRSKAAEKIPRLTRNPNPELLLSVENLQTHFPVKRGLLQRTVNHVRAVDGVNLTLRRGETLALVGESGCGKTTAGHSILRLLTEAHGRVLFEGRNILELERKDLKQLRARMQIVFQDPFASLSPRKKVGSIIGEGLTVHMPQLKRPERESRVGEVLELTGLPPDAASRYPHEFSGGQRQRIALARALILEPDFLVLDEPTSALDVSVQAQILNLLEEIQTRRNLAYLFITHDLGVVEYIADYVAVMYLGRIVEYAATTALFAEPRHPYTRALLQAVPRIGERVGFSRIEGDVPSPLNPPSGCAFHPRCPFATEICREQTPSLDPIGNKQERLAACLRLDAIRDL